MGFESVMGFICGLSVGICGKVGDENRICRWNEMRLRRKRTCFDLNSICCRMNENDRQDNSESKELESDESNTNHSKKPPIPPIPMNSDGNPSLFLGMLPSDFALLHASISSSSSSSTSDFSNDISNLLPNNQLPTTSASSYAYIRSLNELQKFHPLLNSLRLETLQKYNPSESMMMISNEQVHFLTFLTTTLNPTKVLEIGSFTGLSTLNFALSFINDTRIENRLFISVDIDSNAQNIAQKYVNSIDTKNKLRFEFKTQDGIEFMDTLLNTQDENSSWDLIFIDANKEKYQEYFELALQLLRDGGVLIVDDSLWSGRVYNDEYQDRDTVSIRNFNLKAFNDSRVTSTLIPLCDGMTMSVKLPLNTEEQRDIQSEFNEIQESVQIGMRSDVRSIERNRFLMSIEGNISVGKSTFLNEMERLMEKEYGIENVRIFYDDPNSVFLKNVYENPSGIGFAFEIYMLQNSIQNQKLAETQNNIQMCIFDRSIWGNQAFTRTNYRIGNLSDTEFSIYNALLRSNDCENDCENFIVYLDASPELCFQRLNARGNPDEIGKVSLDYLEQLDTTYCEMIIEVLSETNQRNTLIVLDWSEFQNVESVWKRVHSIGNGNESECQVEIRTELKNEQERMHVFSGNELIMLNEMIRNKIDLFQGLEIPRELTIALVYPSQNDETYHAFKRVFMYFVARSLRIVLYKQ